MKIVLALSLLFAAPLFAHEGHDHTPPPPPSTPASPEVQEPFSELATHLSFKTAHLHAFWSQPPQLGSASTVRFELRDFATHNVLNESATIYFGYRHEDDHDFTLAEVVPAKEADGSPIPGTFDTSGIEFDKVGKWEFFALLKRAGETAGIKSFEWALNEPQL